MKHVFGIGSGAVTVYVAARALRGARVPAWFLWLTLASGAVGVIAHGAMAAGLKVD